MRTVFFGLAEQYDSGSDPSVALNASGTVLDVHKNQMGTTLYYRVGHLNGASVQWGSSHAHDGGTQPDCTINVHNVAVEVHKNEAGSTLYTQVGTVSPSNNTVTWRGAKNSGGGYTPGVALNDNNMVIEVHRTDNVMFTDRLYIRVGKVNNMQVNWEKDYNYDSGYFPRVALNNNGAVVEVHQAGSSEHSSSGLWFRVGRINESKVAFDRGAIKFDDGVMPSVALTNDGDVIVVWMKGNKLFQRVGKISNSTIEWTGDALQFDDGKAPSVSAAGGIVLQTHQSETILYGLFFSSSILTDRAIWMQERLNVLGSKPISALALPASHDSSMYRSGPIESFAKTQDLSIYDQLEYGIRWFDLRVRWTGSKFVMHHGAVDGPDLSDILTGIQKFAQHGHKELALLKFRVSDANNDAYTKMTDQISGAIGSWMIKSKPSDKRLAQCTLNDYVKNGTALMVVVTGDYAIHRPSPGFWVYRDGDAGEPKSEDPYRSPAYGDLRVYDIYSDTMSLDTMIADQKRQFFNYNGYCVNYPTIPCDLYLLSWTLTPPTDVWDLSKSANRCLGQQITTIPTPNAYQKIINMVYVDYVEYARVTDVVLFMNGAPLPRY